MYRVAHGGRGSGKTRSFALMAAVAGMILAEAGEAGLIVCGREYQNSLAESSFAEVKLSIEEVPWLAEHYDIGETYIRTKNGLIEFAFVGLRKNIQSLKSKARIRILWVDEAEYVSEDTWLVVDPTVREEGAEVWITYNPGRKNSATNKRFRLNPPPETKIVEMNWRDNPWFTTTLDKKRQQTLIAKPEQYDHIWEGGYVSVVEGAYFAQHLAKAKAEGRICRVAADPLMTVRLVFDIGGTGQKADAAAIWATQWIAKEIRLLKYYEAVGQPLSTHIGWLKNNGYGPKDNTKIILPHDGETHDRVHAVSYESALQAAGYEVQVIPNQGRGAAMIRVEAARRLFPRMWFDDRGTEAGRSAVGWYHEKIDPEREIGLGPMHDWSSHGADAFGLNAVAYEEPTGFVTPEARPSPGVHGWMA